MATLDRSAPLLSLEEWREIIGWNPWHFWGLAGDAVPITSACNTAVTQYGWQSADAAGRADILEAISAAEETLIEHLGFAPAPRWEIDELPFPQFNDRRGQFLSAVDAIGEWMPFKLKHGEVLEIGAMARTAIGTPAVTLSDTDSDNLDDTFTLTIATTVTDPDEIAVYFDSGDRFDGSGVSERWRVRPVSVSIAGGTATIKGKAWTIVRPVLYEGASSAALDPATAANFASTLAVYRLYTSSADQGEFVWETEPGGCVDCTSGVSNAQDPSAISTVDARYVIRNSELGFVAGETAAYDSTLGEWVAQAWAYGYAPTRVRVNYLAGRPMIDGRMMRQMMTVVARMAAAELSRRICACDVANRELYRWQFDRARSAGVNDEQYSIDPRDLGNPFGTREGHIWAWKQVKSLALVSAVSA
jgi:hypothetical protein